MDTKSNQPFEPQQAITTMQRFITGKLLQSGLSGYVIGLSGGIDSAVAAALAVRAVGPDKLFGVLLPYKSSAAHSESDARLLANQLGLQSKMVDISPMIDAYFGGDITPDLRTRAGNKMARERMAILFDVAHQMNRLVLGTGNRTEICLGYTTWYGDSACSVNPVGELYKSELRTIAEMLQVPESIRKKHPTADLWEGQTDEGEIGVAYDRIDDILRRIVDRGETSMAALEADGFTTTEISRIVSMLTRNAFKRHLPDIAPLGKKPIPDIIQLQP